MTPTRFRACLEALGWSQRHLSTLLACDTNLPTRWARGVAQVPPGVAAWLDALASHAETMPPPERERWWAA